MSTVLLSRRNFYVRCWRPLERALSRIIRGWPKHTVTKRGKQAFGGCLAPCDSFLINGTPWLCLCCLRVRRRIAGADIGGRPETVVTRDGTTYEWEEDLLPLERARRAAMERLRAAPEAQSALHKNK